MSHGKIREDKNCLNCGHLVQERFCPHCGQENTENRQPFHYLFSHFFEDFTHYDGQFWKTLKYLLFFPGKLTKIYLSGKRQQYVPPVKLYIFVSFVTFFIASFLSIGNQADHNNANISIDSLTKSVSSEEEINKVLNTENISKEDSIELQNLMDRAFRRNASHDSSNHSSSLHEEKDLLELNSFAEYDSIHHQNPSLIRKIFRPYVKKYFELKENNVPLNGIVKGFVTVFMHTFPKALFFYLPVFAFILYVFHDKKKWWFYDHGVFTLHYFSFLLLILSFFLVLNLIEPTLSDYNWFSHLSTWLYAIALIYAAIYFFIAHHQFYATSKRRSIIVGTMVFIVNSIAFTILLLILVSISLLLLH